MDESLKAKPVPNQPGNGETLARSFQLLVMQVDFYPISILSQRLKEAIVHSQPVMSKIGREICDHEIAPALLLHCRQFGG